MSELKKPDWNAFVEDLRESIELKKDYRLHLRFNKTLLDALTQECKKLGVTRTLVIETLIKDFLKRGQHDSKSDEVPKSDGTTSPKDDTGQVSEE